MYDFVSIGIRWCISAFTSTSIILHLHVTKQTLSQIVKGISKSKYIISTKLTIKYCRK